MVGLPALRALLSARAAAAGTRRIGRRRRPRSARACRLVDELAAAGHGLIMVMGKGGVGKTTIAAAIAVGLVERGHAVHLSTTDPAAHLAATLAGEVRGPAGRPHRPEGRDRALHRQDHGQPRARTSTRQGAALLLEDLRSPCTEEVAVFHAFSRIVAEARSGFVVLDTAPTGHTLLLMDATGAYHRQMTARPRPQRGRRAIVTPLMRLQDPELDAGHAGDPA